MAELIVFLSEGLAVASIYAYAHSPAIERNPPVYQQRAVPVVTQWNESAGQQLSEFAAAISAVDVAGGRYAPREHAHNIELLQACMLVEEQQLWLASVGGRAREQVHVKLAHGTLASREVSANTATAWDLRSPLMTDSLAFVSKAPV